MEEMKQRNNGFSLSGIASVLTGLAAIVIVSYILYASHLNLRKYVYSLERQKLKGLASSTSETISVFIREHMESLATMARSKELAEQIEEFQKNPDLYSMPIVETFFEIHKGDIISLSLANAAGDVVYKETASWRRKSLASNIFVQGSTSGHPDESERLISNIFTNETGQPVFTLTVPVYKSGTLIGFAQAEISTKIITEAFVTPTIEERREHIWLVDENGTVVSFPEVENSSGKKAVDAAREAAAGKDISGFVTLLNDMMRDHAGYGEYLIPRFGDADPAQRMMLASFDRLKDSVPWSIAVVENKEAFMPQIERHFYFTIIVIGVFVTIFVTGGFIVYRMQEQKKTLETEKKYLGIIADTASQLHEREAEFRLAFEVATDAIIWHDSETGIVSNCNTATEELLGKHRSEIFGKHIRDIFPSDEAEKYMEAFSRGITEEGEAEFEADIAGEGDSTIPVHVSASETIISDRKVVQSIIRDITDLKKAEDELQEYNNILSQRVRELNCLYGISRLMENKNLLLEEVYGRTVNLIPLSWHYPGEACARLFIDGREYKTKNFQDTKWKISSRVYCMSESIGVLEVCYLSEKPEADHGPFTNEEVALLNTIAGRLGLLIEKKRVEDKAEYLSTHDALTGLPNRFDFLDKLNWSIEYAKRYGGERAVLFIDLDKFKKVNDTYGHEMGDKVLKEAADRLRSILRSTDHVCRLGGDEFTVTIAGPGHHNAQIVAEKISSAISQPFSFNGVTIDFVSPSIGISIYPTDGEEVTTLLGKADAAMYEAKKSGKDFVFYKDMKSESA